MAWTAPRTWVSLEKVTAALMNTHLRDNLNAVGLVEWTTWSPSYTAVTVGNGTVVARYMQIGEAVECHWSLTLGSSSSIGSNPRVSLPVTASSGYHSEAPFGTAYFLDSGTASYMGRVLQNSTTELKIQAFGADGGVGATVNSTTPFTWTTNDIISFEAAYEAA